MSPKEKAEILLADFDLNGTCQKCEDDNNETYMCPNMIKFAAIKAVELRLDGHFSFTSIEYGEDSIEYWQQVKIELEQF